jgi:hypothetical protein
MAFDPVLACIRQNDSLPQLRRWRLGVNHPMIAP